MTQTTREATGVETVVTRDGSAQIHRDEQHKRSAIYAKTDKGTLHGVTAELQLLKAERERRAAAAIPAVAAQIRAESIKIKIDDRDIDLLLKENPLLLYRIVCRVIANGGVLAETTKEKLEAAPPSDSFTRQFSDRYGYAPAGTTMLEIATNIRDLKKARNVHALAVVAGGPAGQPEESPRPFFPGRR
ncbi:MAG: hypothetical protein A2103_03100 [Gammaproteobacteria bacterium GWF2_41_13]|nr:MAG: hypothetical protein A2103_03100 [Gammaproteobacteria bacterium GWF2_41_13]